MEICKYIGHKEFDFLIADFNRTVKSKKDGARQRSKAKKTLMNPQTLVSFRLMPHLTIKILLTLLMSAS